MKTDVNSTLYLNTAGDRLKRCLKHANMQQKDLAKEAGYSVQTVSMIARNRQPLQAHHAVAFADVLGVRPDYLLMKSDFMTNEEMVSDLESTETKKDAAVISLIEAMGYKVHGLTVGSGVDGVSYYKIETPAGDVIRVRWTDFKRTITSIRRYVLFCMSDSELNVDDTIVPFLAKKK